MATLHGRKIDDIVVDGVDAADYPDFCDSYISSATWADTGEFLDDIELMELIDSDQVDVHELAYDNLVMGADLYCGDMER